MDLALELALILLLAATLFHALRLERALGVLRRDRAELESLVTAFDTSTQQAEQGVARLRAAAEGAGAELSRQMERGTSLRDDLHFLTERANAAADRLEQALRQARQDAAPAMPVLRASRADDIAPDRLRSQAERDLLQALRAGRVAAGVESAP